MGCVKVLVTMQLNFYCLKLAADGLSLFISLSLLVAKKKKSTVPYQSILSSPFITEFVYETDVCLSDCLIKQLSQIFFLVLYYACKDMYRIQQLKKSQNRKERLWGIPFPEKCIR